jgi:hypothetical protein
MPSIETIERSNGKEMPCKWDRPSPRELSIRDFAASGQAQGVASFDCAQEVASPSE